MYYAGDYSNVFTTGTARRVHIQQSLGKLKLYNDALRAMELVVQYFKDHDYKNYSWKTFPGSVHPVQPNKSWFLGYQESLSIGGALGADRKVG